MEQPRSNLGATNEQPRSRLERGNGKIAGDIPWIFLPLPNDIPTIFDNASRSVEHECDGWYIYSNISNAQKTEDLKRISNYYHLGLKIEEGKPE